jgi:hypothetical protein
VNAMTSIDQIIANRKNAARSRGPRTGAGKARASRNALRHGLTISVLKDLAAWPEAEKLAGVIAGPNASGERLTQALTIAETQLDLRRIRDAQTNLMNSACLGSLTESEGRGQGALSGEATLEVLPQLLRWHDYERKILSRRKRAMRAFLFNLEV